MREQTEIGEVARGPVAVREAREHARALPVCYVSPSTFRVFAYTALRAHSTQEPPVLAPFIRSQLSQLTRPTSLVRLAAIARSVQGGAERVTEHAEVRLGLVRVGVRVRVGVGLGLGLELGLGLGLGLGVTSG